MPTLEENVASLVAATTALTSTVNVRKSTLDAAVTTAQNSATAAAGSLNAVSQVNAVANAAATLCAASAQQAATARDLALAAWGAATAPAETLAAMSQVTHIGLVVETLIVDTSKHSAEWRKRCQQTSWFHRTLGGDRWIPAQATVAAAWAAAGNATGAVFMASATAGPITAGKFYTATSASAATEVLEGVSRDFPALYQANLEASRVVIYDLTAPGCPMWMVIRLMSGGSWATFPGLVGASNGLSSLAYREGVLYIGQTGMDGGLTSFNFATGRIFKRITNGGYGGDFLGDIGSRHLPLGFAGQGGGASLYAPLVNYAINDIAATVLPDAPIDPSTGLLVPTVAVATAGGGSIIRNDGSVVNTASTVNMTSVAFNKDGDAYFGTSVASNVFVSTYPQAAGHGVTRYTSATVPALSAAVSNIPVPAGNQLAIASATGLRLLKENPSTPALGMVAVITNTVPGAWQEGDSRGAWLISAEAETVGPSVELASATYAAIATYDNVLSAVTSSSFTSTVGATANRAFLNIATVAGKTYSVVAQTTASAIVRAGNGAGGVGSFLGSVSAAGTAHAFNFVAAGATSSISFEAVAVATFSASAISIKQVEPDRSVKGKGLSIVGTLTMALLGGVAMYTGWGATNYAEIASTDQDYGTGDFHYMWWELIGNASLQTVRFDRSLLDSQPGRVRVRSGATGYELNINGVGIATNVAQSVGLHFCALTREAGTLRLYLDGVLVWSAANTASVTCAGAVLRVGTDTASVPAWAGTNMNYLRTSATALSADDVAKIYRDELQLFQPGAVGTLAGPSNAVTALAYDPVTDITHTMTSWGRSSFKGFVRVDSEASAVGTPSSISTQGGVVSTAGSTGARIYMPALTLREELKRKDEARAALGRVPWVIWFDAIAAQTVFPLPKGTRPLAVYSANILRREGTGRWYTVTDDGYQKAVKAAIAPGAGTEIAVMVVRE